MCLGRPSFSVTVTYSRSIYQEASFICLIGTAAQHTQHKQVAQDAISILIVIHVCHCTHPECHNGTHPQNSTWLLTLIKLICKQALFPLPPSPLMSLGTSLGSLGTRPVTEPGGVHGFHGPPLSQESSADYVVR